MGLCGTYCSVLAITSGSISCAGGGPRLGAFQPGNAFVEIPLLPAPNGRFRGLCSPHDFEGATAVYSSQFNLRQPEEFVRRVPVIDNGAQLSAVVGSQTKADVVTSHGPTGHVIPQMRIICQVDSTRVLRAIKPVEKPKLCL